MDWRNFFSPCHFKTPFFVRMCGLAIGFQSVELRTAFARTREHRRISNPLLMAVDATGSSRKCSRLHAIVAITGKNGESAIERNAPRLPALFDS